MKITYSFIEINQLEPSAVNRLFEDGLNINQRDENGNQLIHYVSNIEILYLLVEKGADVNAQNYAKQTPLFFVESAVLCRALISLGANVNARDEVNNTPLFFARNVNIASALVEKNLIEHQFDDQLDHQINAQNYSGKTPLMVINDLHIIHFLLFIGANVNQADNRNESALFNASYKKAKLLLEYGIDTEIAEILTKNTALFRDDPKFIQLLLQYNANIEHQNYVGQTPIFYYENLNSLQVMFEAGANFNHLDSNGNNVFISHRFSSVAVIDFLLIRGVDPFHQNKFGRNIFYYQMSEPVFRLLSQYTDFNHLDQDGRTPLMVSDVSEFIKMMIQKGVDVNAIDDYGRTALFGARYEKAKILVDAGINIRQMDNLDRTALFFADLETMTYLIQTGASVKVIDRNKRTPLFYTTNVEQRDYLLQSGVDPNVRDQFGKTYDQYEDEEIEQITSEEGRKRRHTRR